MDLRLQTFSSWNELANNWGTAKDIVRTQWGVLTREDVDRIAGSRTRLVEILATDYRMSPTQAEREIEEFLRLPKALGA